MTSRRFHTHIALLAILLLVLPARALAQTGTASITGLITDETGAALPGVTVTATNQATNVEQVAVMNEAGNYTITPLTVGIYVIKAELSGFRTSTTAPIPLEARQVARIDFKLGVGLAETVDVTDAAPIARGEGQSAVEFRPHDRRADLCQGWQHRRACSLQAVLQRLGAASGRGVDGNRSAGHPRGLRYFAVHGGHRARQKEPTGRTPTIPRPSGVLPSTTSATTSSSRPPTNSPSAGAARMALTGPT